MPSPLTWLLGATAALLVLAMAGLWSYSVPRSEDSAASQVNGPEIPESGVPVMIPTLPPPAELRDVSARPLFSPGRRPGPPHDIATGGIGSAGGSQGDPRYQVSAIVIDDSGRFAVVRDQQSGHSARIMEGESIGGWSVVRIAADRVVLERNGERSELPLRHFRPPGSPPPPAPPAKGGSG